MSLIFLAAKPRFVVVMVMTISTFKPASFKLEGANHSIVAVSVTVHSITYTVPPSQALFVSKI